MRVDDGKQLISFWEISMPEWGNLAEYPLAGLMSRILWQKRTGILKLVKENYKKEIFFKNGIPFNAKSNMVSETLGRYMLRKGIINKEAYEKSLEVMSKTKKRQGGILIEMGAIGPTDLSKSLTLQANDRILAAAAWAEGDFSFEETSEFSADLTPVKINPIAIISHAVRKLLPPERIAFEIDLIREFKVRKANAKNLAKLTNEPTEILFYDSFPEGDVSVGAFIDKAVSAGMVAGDVERRLFFFLTHNLMKVLADRSTGVAHAVVGSQVPVANGEDDTGPVSEKERELQKIYLQMKSKNYFELFEIPQNASVGQIKKGYFKLAKEYHPDKHFDSETGQTILAADDIFTMINEASQTLLDETKRKNYLHFLETGESEADLQAKAINIINAEVNFTKGEVYLKKKNYDGAIEEFERAIELNPEESEYTGYLGWAIYKKYQTSSPQQVERAQGIILRAATVNPKFDAAYYWLGFIEKVAGNMAEAEKHFRKTLEINRNNMEATREIRLIEMRKK
jgi:curved DNA-binding protein CbpA